MRDGLFVRILLVGSLLAVAACANSGAMDTKSDQAHSSQQVLMLDGGTGGGGGGGGGY